jgi:hypothetical protein
MNTDTGFREVSTDEQRAVDGGNAILRAIVIIMTADQQRTAAGSGPTLVHEPKHQ